MRIVFRMMVRRRKRRRMVIMMVLKKIWQRRKGRIIWTIMLIILPFLLPNHSPFFSLSSHPFPLPPFTSSRILSLLPLPPRLPTLKLDPTWPPQTGLKVALEIRKGVALLTPEVGVRVVVHDPRLLPALEEEGFSIGPGVSSVAVRRVSASGVTAAVMNIIMRIL